MKAKARAKWKQRPIYVARQDRLASEMRKLIRSTKYPEIQETHGIDYDPLFSIFLQ